MIRKLCFLSLAASLAPELANAQEVQPHLWIAPGLYGLERSACGRPLGVVPADDTAMVASTFCPLLDSAHRERAGARFVQLMSVRFPSVEAKFAGHMPTDSTPRARLASTLVASLRLTRATIWTVPKGPVTDAFLPITLTLDIINPGTGEVVFTRTRSEIGQGSFATSTVDADLSAQFDAQLDQAMVALVNEAAGAWKPYPITGAVRARVEGGWLLDRGRQAGLREGDAIGPDGHVRFAGPDYAVVAPTLGEYTIGQTLSRTVLQPTDMLARPSVLAIIAAAPDNYARPYLTQLFEAALGQVGRLAPLPVNPGFVALRAMAIGKAEQLSNDERSLPDYIARVSVYAIPPSAIPSNVPGVVVDTYEAHVFVELVDRSGRIVFTAHGTNRIVDENVGAMRFAVEQRRDTTIRNALLDAAKKLSAFQLQSADLSIAHQDGQMLVSDPGGVLPLGAQAVVLRDLGRVGGIANVRVPIGRVRIEEIAAGGLVVSSVEVTALRLKSGDRVLALGGGLAAKTRRAVSQCVDNSGGDLFDDRGGTSLPLWRLAAGNSFASSFAAPVYVTGIELALEPYETQFAGWRSLPVTQARTADYCYTPVAAIVPAPAGEKRHGLTGRQFAITLGYALYRGDEKLAGGGLQMELTGTRLPADTELDTAQAVLERDFAMAALPLAGRAAAALAPPM